MSTVIIADSEHPTQIQVGDKLFDLYQGDDGTLYIEGSEDERLEFTISDNDESVVTAIGFWVNIDFAKETE